MATVKKRLHVSGLTPAITAQDINSRLLGFGKVHALDGFGAIDGVGQPKKFAYVTLEATEANLSRCLNVLSGTTWKGAKLRIGEARPDYTQRLEIERKRALEVEERPVKRRRLPRGVQGFHADDMSPVGLDTVKQRPGWHKTTLSHLIHPMKMRPARPLPELQAKQKSEISKKKRKKGVVINIPTRSRVQTIDPRLYGHVHLRENMLEAVVIDKHAIKPRASDGQRFPSLASSAQDHDLSGPSSNSELVNPLELPSAPKPALSVDVPDFAKERSRDLDLLMSMFSDSDSEWGGKESIDEDMEDQVAPDPGPKREPEPQLQLQPEPGLQPEVEIGALTPTPLSKPKSKSLKDMFKPHEEEAGFSLLAGFGDLDLDPDFDFQPALPAKILPPSVPIPVPAGTPQQSSAGPSLDPSLPLFFPHPHNPREKDILSIALAKGWEFSRSGDADTIRKRWEETKGPLTREWKKRAREAVKARRRRYGVEGEEA